MDRAHIASVAQLHSDCLRDDLLAKLGPEFLRAFYQELLEPGVGFGSVWLEGGRVVGFITGTRHARAFAGRMAWRRPMVVLRALARRPSALRQMWGAAAHLTGPSGRREGAMIRANAVHPDYRRRGIGLALYRRALEQFRELGFTVCRTRVLADDDGVNRLWQQLGGVVEGALTLTGRRIHVYRFDLIEPRAACRTPSATPR